MQVATLEITNKLGLHARAAAKLVNLVNSLEENVTLQNNNGEADASSIMDLLMLAGCHGSTVEISVKGDSEEHEKESLAQIIDLFERKFDEGE